MPPETVRFTIPLVLPLQLTLVTVVVAPSAEAGWEILYDWISGHKLASVTVSV